MRVVSLLKVSEFSRQVEFDAASQVEKLHEANEQGGTLKCSELNAYWQDQGATIQDPQLNIFSSIHGSTLK
jgi:hypothetical protein